MKTPTTTEGFRIIAGTKTKKPLDAECAQKRQNEGSFQLKCNHDPLHYKKNLKKQNKNIYIGQ